MVTKSPIEIRIPDKLFHSKDSYLFPKRVYVKQNRFSNSNWLKL